MKQRKLLFLTMSQLELLFHKKFPDISELAAQATDAHAFRAGVTALVSRFPTSQAKETILSLLAGEGRTIHEMSRDEDITFDAFQRLYRMLRHECLPEDGTALYLDLYSQFSMLYGALVPPISRHRLRILVARWPSGLDPHVMEIRRENKERMIHLLIQRVETHPSRRFCFAESMAYAEKYVRVSQWWNDFRFHLAMALKTPKEIQLFLGKTLSPETMYVLNRARKKGMPFFATPYYLSLLDTSGTVYDDASIRSYLLYSPDLVESFGHIRAWEREDVVEAGRPNAAGWLVPDGRNIHRRYPDVAILIPDTMGRACGGLCASCQRMYDFQSRRLNFEFMQLLPKESWPRKLHRLMRYFEEDTQLRDILITGGDALMSQNKTLKSILDAVLQMARRKHLANAARKDGDKYAELQRVRLGSRLPVYLPMRVDAELVEVLRDFREKASVVGVRQFIVQTHFQTPLEVTPEAREAVRKLHSAGWIVDNQLVYNVAASRRGHTVKLRQVLNSIGVIGYYTFSVKGFDENHAVFAPNARSVQERREEKCYGLVPEEDTDNLAASLMSGADAVQVLRNYMRAKNLTFLATDRNVLNLPAIGKSMTFTLAGFMPDGRRVLLFDYDKTRPHSPVIERLDTVYIAENKSIASYLCQLAAMGEDPEDYASVWGCTSSVTEPRFSLFCYPRFPFKTTNLISNLQVDMRCSPGHLECESGHLVR
ncbi:MAG: KamA family protein [Bacteroidales bacterium]|nr:KamA family protein [Bacteroidales bacterium]